MSDVIYARRPVSRGMWLLPVVLWCAATVALLLISDVALSASQVTLCLLAPGALFGIWLLTLYSINRYGTITLTRDTLRVGRDQLPVASIEPQWVRMLARRAEGAEPSTAERITTSAGALQLPGDRHLDTSRGRLLGGAYGATLGDDLITLELHGNKRVSVPTRDRRGLLAGLVTAVDGVEQA